MPRSGTAGNDGGRRAPGSAAWLPILAAALLPAATPGSASTPGQGNPEATSASAPASRHSDPAPPGDSLASRLAAAVAARYGAGEFHEVASLRYTFHVRFGGKDIARSWTWYPPTDSVAYEGPDPAGLKVSAAWSRRNPWSLKSPGVAPLDKWFINDQYWLLFPLHLAWDKGIRLEAAALPAAGKRPRTPTPSGKAAGAGETHRLTVTYPPEGGYTPGDAYDLFVDSAGTVKRWIFRKGNAGEPTREAAWSAPERHGPLALSLERKGGEDFRLWFTDVRVETRD